MVGDERISKVFEFKITGAAERKERKPKLMLDGVGTRKCWSEGEVNDNECGKKNIEWSL